MLASGNRASHVTNSSTRMPGSVRTFSLAALKRDRVAARTPVRRSAGSADFREADVTLMLPDDLLLMIVRCAAATLTATVSTALTSTNPRRHPSKFHYKTAWVSAATLATAALAASTLPTSASAAAVARCGMAETALSMEAVCGRHLTLTQTGIRAWP